MVVGRISRHWLTDPCEHCGAEDLAARQNLWLAYGWRLSRLPLQPCGSRLDCSAPLGWDADDSGGTADRDLSNPRSGRWIAEMARMLDRRRSRHGVLRSRRLVEYSV